MNYCKCGEPVHPVRQKYGYKTCEGIVRDAVFSQFSVQDLNIVIPIEDLNSAEFYVETPNNIRKLTLNEIY